MTKPASPPWYTRIGPGLITACVVIGPGSIMTSSSVGAKEGYGMLWVVIVSVVFMMVYMTLGAKLGAVAKEAPCDLIRSRAGKPLAYALGLIVFFISAAFQSGNNIGVAAAFEAFVDDSDWLIAVLVIAFNALAISFLFIFKNLYQTIEKLMMGFVALMLISFAVNLFRLGPSLTGMAKGFIPSPGDIDITVLGLIGTTFVITAAFYQAYLVRQKGWDVDDVKSGLVDARVGSVIMALITIMLMSTAAAGLYREGETVQLSNPVAVADALKPTFGESGRIIFCLGLFSAAYSSFLINSMIGGFMAADGLGLGSNPRDLGPRVLTTLVLLTGMSVALAVIVLDFDRTPTIIAAQAVTVVGSPLVAGVLLWLTSRRDVMGDRTNGTGTMVLAGVGLVLLLGMAANTAFISIPKKVNDYLASIKAAAAETPPETPAEATAGEPAENEDADENADENR